MSRYRSGSKPRHTSPAFSNATPGNHRAPGASPVLCSSPCGARGTRRRPPRWPHGLRRHQCGRYWAGTPLLEPTVNTPNGGLIFADVQLENRIGDPGRFICAPGSDSPCSRCAWVFSMTNLPTFRSPVEGHASTPEAAPTRGSPRAVRKIASLRTFCAALDVSERLTSSLVKALFTPGDKGLWMRMIGGQNVKRAVPQHRALAGTAGGRTTRGGRT